MATNRNSAVPYGLLVPYVVVVTVFLLVPVISLVQVSFRMRSPTEITGMGFTFANYMRVLEPFYFWILVDTLRYSLVAGAIAAVLGYPLAYLLARSARLSRTILSLLVMIPLMTSVVVKVFGWYIILEPGGVINQLSGALGMGRLRLLHNPWAVIVGLVEFSLPFMVFSVASAIERIPLQVEEAAGNLGANPWQVMRRIVLPLSRTGLLSGYLLCVGVAASAYVVPAIMGGTRVRMAGQQIYDDVLVGFDWPGASAFSVVLVIMLSLIFYVAVRLDRRA